MESNKQEVYSEGGVIPPSVLDRASEGDIEGNEGMLVVGLLPAMGSWAWREVTG